MSGKFEYNYCFHALTQAALTFLIATISPLNMDSKDLYDVVQNRYGELAGKEEHTSAQENAAKAFGYGAAELSSIPAGANLGVSCGNPIALANIHEVSPYVQGHFRLFCEMFISDLSPRAKLSSTWVVVEASMSC